MIKKLPLIGELWNVKKVSLISAVKELVISTVFSILPIWFFPLISSLFISGSPSLKENMYSSVNQGDLFIYSSALVGPLIFAITNNYAEWGDSSPSPSASRIGKLTFEFPYGTYFFFISISVCMIAAICFGLHRFSSTGLITVKLNTDALFNFSLVIYLFSLFCLFCVSVYRNELENFTTTDGKTTRNFVEEWNSRNG